MKAETLKSGKYRCRVYDYTDSNGVKHYRSFTSESKKEAERLATEYKYRHDHTLIKENMTVREAVGRYIDLQRSILSPTTIHAYERYKEYAFPNLMEIYTTRLTNIMLREAVAKETLRTTQKGSTISAKSVKNEYFLVAAALKIFAPDVDTNVPLPRSSKKIVDLPKPEEIYNAVKGTSIELAVMLAMWLSFSMSEIKGLKRTSIYGDYIQIDQVMVRVGTKHVEKDLAKVDTRTRRHRIPPYIAQLIASLPKEQEYLVPYTANALNGRLKKLLDAQGITPISFHKLRHINASTMALLQIPDKYAQERGGWATDSTMKNTYQHTFSEERIIVDNKIDDYFNEIVGIKKSKVKYKDFIKFMNLNDCDQVKKIYDDLIQYIKN